MRAKFLQDIIDETPKDVEIFVRWYADLTVRINRILKEKGISQKELAESLGKKPSEINKWLKGEHNFTLRSLAKLQAELGEELIHVPQNQTIYKEVEMHEAVSFTVLRTRKHHRSSKFEKYKLNSPKSPLSRVS
ncbi:MAG: helix-turn-helix transcriptional regulator [Bacteroidetes bacterium]|nr:helix-turn-helix transcriptional regulator [Bacteroidota bacterium]